MNVIDFEPIPLTEAFKGHRDVLERFEKRFTNAEHPVGDTYISEPTMGETDEIISAAETLEFAKLMPLYMLKLRDGRPAWSRTYIDSLPTSLGQVITAVLGKEFRKLYDLYFPNKGEQAEKKPQ